MKEEENLGGPTTTTTLGGRSWSEGQTKDQGGWGACPGSLPRDPTKARKGHAGLVLPPTSPSLSPQGYTEGAQQPVHLGPHVQGCPPLLS